MRLSKATRERFRQYGKLGGKTRANGMSPEARKGIACQAALTRWIVTRFGGPSFAALGLPGGEVVDYGLRDLAFGKDTIESLVVSLAAPRLRREGVPVPRTVLVNPDQRLYVLLTHNNAALAHSRYLAYLRQVCSFADACGGARLDGVRHDR